MDSKEFFSRWSTACLLARSAIEEGAGEPGERALMSLQGWESAKAEGSHLSPLALMAMADPGSTTSGRRRAPLDTATIILNSPALSEALADPSPLNLARCAIGAWLWHPLAQAPEAGEGSRHSERLAPSPLIEGLAKEAMKLGIHPLGPSGSLAAAQQFASRMWLFDPEAYRAPFTWRMDSPEQAQARREKDELAKAATLARELEAAKILASLMPEPNGAAFLSAVEACHAAGPIPDEPTRRSAHERLILSMAPAAASARRAMSL